MKEIEVKKGQILQRRGEFNSKVFQVKTGLLRSYAIDRNGKENIFMFAPEGWTVGDYTSPDEPTKLFIDALEDTTVLILPKDLERERDNVGPIINWMAVLQTRIIMLISTNAIERYEHFIKTYPEIVQRVPQRMIASYLGVTPETLSAAKRSRPKKEE